MNASNWTTFWDKLEAIYKKQDGNLKAYEAEQPVLKYVLAQIAEGELRDRYHFVEPIGRGGAGIVIRVKDIALDQDRALKVPRPREEALIRSVRLESAYLTRIIHENIIAVHTLGEVKVPDYPAGYPYFIMDYIHEAQDLRRKVGALASTVKSSSDLSRLTRWIADKFYRIADAIKFLHKHDILHFDVKPANILIDSNDKPVLSDLGFAKKRSSDEKETMVGFTLFYAHPHLRFDYRHMSSKNRVKKSISPKNFLPQFDIYPYGKSLLEILALLHRDFSDIVVYDYTFVYLHLAACRMLDGENASREETDKIRSKQLESGEEPSAYYETWIELDRSAFDQIKYTEFDQICRDLEKLLFDRYFLGTVTEIDMFYHKRVQCSDGMPAPFSDRVRYIIEHPVFRRLSQVPQLGLLSNTYPTASHTRLEHSIGVFRNCCLYIQALYNDQFNPLFRQLMNEEDIRCILVASLLHDLGHFPLAHELEEVDREVGHEALTIAFLDNPTRSKWGHTLKEVIENEDWGWGVSLAKLKKVISQERRQILMFQKRDMKCELLRSIIDGPIDADKLDYLLRDSQNCYLKYGELIDFDRLIRNLTVIISRDENQEKSLSIGIYERGQSAAESLTFARYLLYQALYWHRNARAVRVMLREALRPGLRTRTRGKDQRLLSGLEKVLGVRNTPKTISIDDLLKHLQEWTDVRGSEILQMITDRKYYKRIVTIHDDELIETGKKSFLDRLREAHSKVGFQERLQQRISDAFQNVVSQIRMSKLSQLSPEKLDFAGEILTKDRVIICDCPEPSHGTRKKLRIIPEPERYYKNYFDRAHTSERVSEVWHHVYFKLMNIAAKARVFCHPDIRDSLSGALGLNTLKGLVKDVVDEHTR